MKMIKRITLIIITVCTVIISNSYLNVSLAFPPDNQWSPLVTETCRTDTARCTNLITQGTNSPPRELLACIQCCRFDNQTCNNYCICECGIKAAPNNPVTLGWCSFPPPPQQPAAPPQQPAPSSSPEPTPSAETIP